MSYPLDLVKASLQAGRTALSPPRASRFPATQDQEDPVIVPIRSLGANQRARVVTHLLALNAQDRYLRFGYAVQDDQIRHYVAGLNFNQDEIFGIFDRKLSLLAVAHLAYGHRNKPDACAEFGVSVLERARGRGYGKRLFDRAAMHAANQGVQTMFIHALSENAAMLSIARTAGARVQREGTESEAYLQLPQASINSRISEAVENQLAEADYQLKVQAKQFWGLVSILQEVRRSVSEAQNHNAQ
jgi:GNAT superfamily N-acetyltransferase